MAAQLLDTAKPLVREHELWAHPLECTGELIVVCISARQAIIIHENPKLADTHRRVVEMRKKIDRRSGGMHGGLIGKVNRSKHAGIGSDRHGEITQALEKRMAGGSVFCRDLEDRLHVSGCNVVAGYTIGVIEILWTGT